MDVVLARSAGFCYGVKRALDTVVETAKAEHVPMFTLGPLIHNPQVIAKLEEEGVRTVRDLKEVPSGSVVVMPTHGVPASVLDRVSELGLEVVDVTCPFVAKVHRLADDLVSQGYQVVILGDEGHTEVRGILSRAGENAVVVSDPDDLDRVELKNHVGVVAQTTQAVERYQRLVGEVSGLVYEVRAYNTICNATAERQKAAVGVAESVDLMIVVGGRNSANTRRLAEVCAETGVPTHHVEVASEMDQEWFDGVRRVGVTAGASTPDWIINEVVETIRSVQPAENVE